MSRIYIVFLIVVLLLWGRTTLYAVDQAEYAFVTRFGERVAVHDGADAAGLHVKAPWPIDSVQSVDRRVQSFDLPAVESLTRDPVNRTVDKTLAVDAYVTWKVPDADAADRFFLTVRTPEQARKILGPMVNGRLANAISTLPIDDIIGVADAESAMAGVAGLPAVVPADVLFRAVDARAIEERAERVRRRVLGEEGATAAEATVGDHLRARARSEYGIEIVDVRVRRFSYPEAVRGSIAERIRSERRKKVADYESEGSKRAADITTDADRVYNTIAAEARAKKTVIEGQANADSARIRASAYAQDRDFYLFLEGLRAFQSAIAETHERPPP